MVAYYRGFWAARCCGSLEGLSRRAVQERRWPAHGLWERRVLFCAVRSTSGADGDRSQSSQGTGLRATRGSTVPFLWPRAALTGQLANDTVFSWVPVYAQPAGAPCPLSGRERRWRYSWQATTVLLGFRPARSSLRRRDLYRAMNGTHQGRRKAADARGFWYLFMAFRLFELRVGQGAVPAGQTAISLSLSRVLTYARRLQEAGTAKRP